MTITATGAHLEFDCAHADIAESISLDSTGSFSAPGTFVFEGGPIRLGDPPDPRAAVYSGKVQAITMHLVVQVIATNQTIGPFLLVRSETTRLMKCL